MAAAETDKAPPADLELCKDLHENLRAQLKVGNTDYDVQLTQTHLSWDKLNRKDKTVFSHSVAIADIITVRDVPPDTHGRPVNSFSVHYVIRQKNYIWKVTTTNFQAQDEGTRKTWIDNLQQGVEYTVSEQDRPQNVIVLINPKSGSSQGVKIYEKHGAPLFDLAGVKTKVTVSERAHHIVEILQQCDLEGVDGIVVVGGDGTLTEAVDGVLRRYMKEAGRDYNDPEQELVTCPIRIGLIPAGTGQGKSHAATGTYDIVTAMLHIIMGFSYPNEVMAAYNDGKLLSYSTLLIGFGFLGELINYAESNRQLGRLRYLPALFKSMTSFMKLYNFDIHYLPTEDFKQDSKENAEAVGNDGWLKAHGPFVALFVFPLNVETLEPMKDSSAIHLMTRTTRTGLARMFYRINTFQPNTFDFDFIKTLKVKMLKIVSGQPSDEVGTEAGAKVNPAPQTNILNIDGEVHKISNPETLIRFHGANYRLFGTAPLIQEMRKKREQSFATSKT